MAGDMSEKPAWQIEPAVSTTVGTIIGPWVLTHGHLHFLDVVAVSQ